MAEAFLQVLGSDKVVVKEDEDQSGAQGSASAVVCRDLQVSLMAPGRILCRLPAVLPRTVNRYGTLHGGAVATLVNVIGSAAIKTLAGTREGVVTDTNISYLSSAPINIKDQLGSYSRKEGIFGWPSAQADHTQTSASSWWEDCGADTPELQALAIRILSQGCSSSPVERLWSTFGHITPKKRNRLGVTKANDLVFVNANKRLLRKISFKLSKERFIGIENPLPTNCDNKEAEDFPDSHVDDEDDVMDLLEGLDDDVIEPEVEPDFDDE